MSEEIKRDRSPNYPKVPLAQAIEIVSGLHKKAGKSQIKAEVAVSALGYSGLNGAALTTLGVLNQYGLIDRTKGEGVAVSSMAIRLIHPVNEAQTLAARRESALKPRVFSELYTGGFQHCSEDVLANHLIQQGFTQDGAKKAASVFKANIEFANLQSVDIKLDQDTQTTQSEQAVETPVSIAATKQAQQPNFIGNEISNECDKKVLATYSVPIGSNEVKIVFTGDSLRPDDFDALADYVTLFKKQYQRKIEAEALKGATSMKEAEINLESPPSKFIV